MLASSATRAIKSVNGSAKRIEEIFGWLKTVGLLRKLRHRGTERVNWIFIFATAAYNLVRMRKLVTV